MRVTTPWLSNTTSPFLGKPHFRAHNTWVGSNSVSVLRWVLFIHVVDSRSEGTSELQTISPLWKLHSWVFSIEFFSLFHHISFSMIELEFQLWVLSVHQNYICFIVLVAHIWCFVLQCCVMKQTCVGLWKVRIPLSSTSRAQEVPDQKWGRWPVFDGLETPLVSAPRHHCWARVPW